MRRECIRKPNRTSVRNRWKTAMRKFLIAAAATAAIALPAFSAGAVSIDPADYDRILTEGYRTTTVDGADVSGHGAIAGNTDILSFSRGLDIGPVVVGEDILFIGNVSDGGADDIFVENVTGILTVDILNFTARTPQAGVGFAADFSLHVDDVLVETISLSGTGSDLIENRSFGPLLLTDQKFMLRAYGMAGWANYDIALALGPAPQPAQFQNQGPGQNRSIATAPIPGGLPLMLGGLALIGFAVAGRRRR